MRPIGIGLAAALVIAAFAPAVVMSAPKAAPAAITPQARKQGMAEAPAAAAAANLACQVTDARFIGKTEDKKAKATTNYYEVDCDKGIGFILQAVSGGPASAFSCVEANTPQADGKPPSVPCILPGNADPKVDIAPMLAKSDAANCVIDRMRGIGQTKTNTFMEISCADGSGYIVQASAPIDPAKPVEAQNCLVYDDADANIKCALTDKAARLAFLTGYATAANQGCAIKERRYVGAATSGSTYFEVSCNDGKGYMYRSEKGAYVQSIECAKALGIMGGCTLTDAREAETAQADLYTKLAKGAGFNCEVQKYAPFPSPSGKDVVELTCSNRPDGAVAVFANPNSASKIYDCARAPIAGFRCSFTKPELAFGQLTADLKKMEKMECAVSASRFVGVTTKGTGLIEVACADGLKGYVIEYSTTGPIAPTGVVGCAFTRDCKLPGNV